jgi:hypothetical protein
VLDEVLTAGVLAAGDGPGWPPLLHPPSASAAPMASAAVVRVLMLTVTSCERHLLRWWHV